jgi:hypothetical protein
MDKAIAKVNQNELDCDHLGRDFCVNFIKPIFQILRNDVIDIWNPIDFQGQRSRSPGQIFNA